jgi:hypothetical protein
MTRPTPPSFDRVAERRRAAALARHDRDVEQLPIAEIARRLGRAPATVKAYLYDPTGEKARAAISRWAELYGCAPTSYDWSRTHARQRGAQALRRLERDEWPSPATVSNPYGTWAAALRVMFDREGSSTSVPDGTFR